MATAVGAYCTAATLQALIAGNQTYDSADTTLMGTICDRVNAYIEQATRRIIAPISSATYLLDGSGNNRLYFPRGIRAVSLLEIAPVTGAPYVTQTSTNYVLRPAAHDRAPGWPALWIELTNMATQNRYFPTGYDNVRATMTTGFDAIPDDVSNLALTVAQRWWNARQSGYQQVDGVDASGLPIAARFFQLPEYQTLNAYRLVARP